MRARVLFFGLLRDLVGCAAENIEVPEGAHLGSVVEHYAALQPRLREFAPSIVAARNQEFADLSTSLRDGDEIAFLPPVSGGTENNYLELISGEHYFALTHQAIDTRDVISRLMMGAEGAVVTFEGTVRNNTNGRRTLYLDYEGYEPMALKTMARIGTDLAGSYAISQV